jgi:uncharacterized protein YndB with AHSA1/START domain
MNTIDIQIESTSRDLGRRLTAVGLGHSVRLRRRFDAPIQAVWAAITEPAQLEKWEGRVSGDLRAGGDYQLEGNSHGAILACNKPHHFAVIWDSTGDPTELDVRLAEAPDGGTLLELEHVAVIPDEYVAGVGQFASNWELGMYLLDEYLHDTLPPEALDWAVGERLTPALEALISRSDEQWTELARSQGYAVPV